MADIADKLAGAAALKQKTARAPDFHLSDIRPPDEDVYDVADAHFEHSKQIGNRTVPIGHVQNYLSSGDDPSRVSDLMEKIKSPDGYFSRPIVDHEGNVLEGQHRTEAAKRLGVKHIPVYEIKDLSAGMPVSEMNAAVNAVGKLHPDQRHSIVNQTLSAIDDSGSPAKARQEYDFSGTAYGKHFEAALSAAEKNKAQVNG